MLEKVEKLNVDKVIEEFEAVTKDAERVQRETLKRILEDNAPAEYLLNLGLNGRTDPETFKACVPLVTHKDLEPYINRMIYGDYSSILTGKPITNMSLSSGTTSGKQKYVPWTDELFETTVQIYQTSFSFRNREFPIKNGKALSFIYGSNQFKTEGGLAAGTATSNLFCDKRYKQAMASLQSQCCSPEEVIFGSDFHQSLYCHLLCGLIFRDQIQLVSSTFAHSLVNAFRTFQQVWEELCHDIRNGVLTSRINDPSIRTAMSKILKPDPELGVGMKWVNRGGRGVLRFMGGGVGGSGVGFGRGVGLGLEMWEEEPMIKGSGGCGGFVLIPANLSVIMRKASAIAS